MHTPSPASMFLAAIDHDWARLVNTIGPCPDPAPASQTPYEALIRAVAYQQLHGKAAAAILGRLLTLHEENFPSPEALLATDVAALRACGFSARKINCIHGLAQASLAGKIPGHAAAHAMDDEALISQLVELPGIGRWTVEMLLMHTLGRPDILPVDDFGVREGYRRLKGLSTAPAPRSLREIGLAWSPYRSSAAWYLWRVPKSG
ncbi:DNA-3-methyladenine glycosylase [Methylobacillus arboreus]|uniref:DNA-3-methyladenine glycosylase family protein n=1 Tax=Methylobacillus arboreus TaxID=755170 RepID=UPI001E48FE97|nr:DNA-3-methyladenine glycosylase [Methylobacillus arboreus]MCB5189941.1 DNA-3-methyladenine glycosylase [Methylobacillus arboreus]